MEGKWQTKSISFRSKSIQLKASRHFVTSSQLGKKKRPNWVKLVEWEKKNSGNTQEAPEKKKLGKNSVNSREVWWNAIFFSQ